MLHSRSRSSLLLLAALVLLQIGCGQKSEDDQVAAKLGISRQLVEELHAKKSLSNRVLLRIEKQEVRDVLRELRPDLPERRASFRNLQLGNTGRFTPPGAIINSLLAVENLRLRTRLPAMGGIGVGRLLRPGLTLPLPPSPIPQQENWTPLGPSNIGGRTRSIVIDPTNTKRIWLGSLGGGIWRSDDGGVRFDPVDDFMGNLAICCLAIDPTDPSTIYAGTGEGFYNGDVIQGAGMFWSSKKTKGKWQVIPESKKPEMRYLTRIAVSPDGKVILASGHNGKPQGPEHAAGIFRSEKEDRSDWAQVSTDEMADIKFHPSNSLLAIASGWGGAWYSTDGGKSWLAASHTGQWPSRVELTYAHDNRKPSNPTIVYALVDINGGEVWKSSNGGKSYSKQSANLSIAGATILGGQGYYDNAIWAWAGENNKPDLVIAGGINLWRSTDGGQSFIDISNWTNSKSVHADHHAIVPHPQFDGSSNKTVYFGNDGGVYRTSDILAVGSDPDRTSGWESLNGTYATTQFYGGAANPTSGTIIAGAQDNGTLRLVKNSGSNGWTVASEGDGGMCFAQLPPSNTFFGEYVLLDLIRLDESGAKDLSGIRGWRSDGTADWKADQYVLPDAKAAFNERRSTANFIAPFALDTQNPKRIFAGGATLWRTENADAVVDDSTGPSWKAVKDPLQATDSVDGLISAVAIMPGNSNVVWVGYNNGRVFRTQSATAQDKPGWEDVDPNGSLPRGRMCTRIFFDPKNIGLVYVTFGGYSKDNVWKSANSGDWKSLHSNLSEMPILALTVHPRDSRILYLGSELGLFVSANSGSSWSPANSGPANCSVQDLFWMNETLIAATHGRGIFSADLKLTPR